MAHLEKHRDAWRVVWRDGGRGSARKKSPLFARKSDALEAQRQIESEQAARAPLTAGAVLTIDELLDRYCQRLKERRHVGHRYPERFRKTVTDLAASRGWKTSADVTPGSIGTLSIGHHRILRAILNFAELQGQRVNRQCLLLPRPERRRKPLAALLTDAELAALLAQAEHYCPSVGLAAHLIATYGHRPESLVHMTCGDVDLASDPPTISMEVKSGDRIRHPITRDTADRLRIAMAFRLPTSPLLLHNGKPWASGSDLAVAWNHYVGAVVTPDRPGIYHLKRRAISYMLGAGLDPATIASITGHRTPAVILTYARTNEKRQLEAVAVIQRIGDTPVTPQDATTP